MKVGRNQPCPCGSGKKYKKCCLGKDEEAAAGNVNYGEYGRRRIRNAEEKVLHMLMEYGEERFGDQAPIEAMNEFFLWGDTYMDEEFESAMMQAFAPWFVFAWNAVEYLEEEEPDVLLEPDSFQPAVFPAKSLAMLFLEEHPDRVSDFERRYIEEACEQPYSYFQVVDAVPGQSLTMKDLLLRRTVTVAEQSASREDLKGEILYTKVITLEDTSVMVGCFTMAVPARYQGRLIDFREGLEGDRGTLAAADIREFDYELRQLYVDVCHEDIEQQIPQMQNTDGEPLVPTKLLYELACTPAVAFHALKKLAWGEKEKDLLSDAVYDENGELAEISFPWLKKGNKINKNWTNTVMGNISITGNRMTVEVNSENRAEKIRKEIRKRLRDQAVYKTSVLTSLEKMMEEGQPQLGMHPSKGAGMSQEELMQIPELKKKINEMAEAHWKEWIDTKVPALGNKTPRQAAADPVGREKLEGLLLQFEATERKNPGMNAVSPDIEKLRRELGLEK